MGQQQPYMQQPPQPTQQQLPGVLGLRARQTAGAYQQQQFAPRSQDATAEASPSDDESDEDALLGLLTGAEASGEAPAAAAAVDDSHPQSWAAVTGGSAGGDDEEAGDSSDGDSDMEAAMAASMAQQQAGGAGAGADSRVVSSVPGVSAAGLANETGEYNCFLNVVVQCLWNCKDFRQQVQALPPQQVEHPVVAALLHLFRQMEAAESGWQPGSSR
jgi:hypothetical protein